MLQYLTAVKSHHLVKKKYISKQLINTTGYLLFPVTLLTKGDQRGVKLKTLLKWS